MTDKPPLWADVLMTLWIFVVGLIYFGGYFRINSVGAWTERASLFYALMLLLSVSITAWRHLTGHKTARVDDGKNGIAAMPLSRQKQGAHLQESQGDPDICLPK